MNDIYLEWSGHRVDIEQFNNSIFYDFVSLNRSYNRSRSEWMVNKRSIYLRLK